MKKLATAVLVLLGVGVWAQNTPMENKPNPEMKRFVYQSKTSIQKRTYDSIYFDIEYVKGDNWVFKYTFKGSEYPALADDEYMESYEFEMAPPKGNSFEIKEADFLKNKVIFNRSCFCPDSGLRQLLEGNIKGKKVGKNKWLVTFDVMIQPRPGREGLPINKKFKGYFNPGNLLF